MVRISATFLARPEYYDRNPISRVLSGYYAAQSPHAFTERWSYTVPAGRKALVSELQLYFYRRTAATTVGLVYAYIQVNFVSGGGWVAVLVQEMVTNNVGDKDHAEVGLLLFLSAGDVIRGADADGSTGGTVSFGESATLTEYDV